MCLAIPFKSMCDKQLSYYFPRLCRGDPWSINIRERRWTYPQPTGGQDHPWTVPAPRGSEDRPPLLPRRSTQSVAGPYWALRTQIISFDTTKHLLTLLMINLSILFFDGETPDISSHDILPMWCIRTSEIQRSSLS
jgi:hypothetical protein